MTYPHIISTDSIGGNSSSQAEPNMKLTRKLAALDKIYAIYADFTDKLELACKKQCSHCCTTNITLTTLEGYKILNDLISNQKFDLITLIEKAPRTKRFQPKLTTNQIAKMCADGMQPPEDGGLEEWEKCLFLMDNACPIYELRPFGCRCLVSRYDCGEKGYAEVEDFVLSVNTVILQTIEHADVHGCTGNLADVVGVLSSEDNQATYRNNALNCQKSGLISNHPLSVLMIPPEHRTRMEPILQKLRQIKL